MSKFLSHNRNSVIRAVSIVAAGSCLFYAKDYEGTMTLSFPALLQESLHVIHQFPEKRYPHSSFLNPASSDFGLPIYSITAADPSPAAEEKDGYKTSKEILRQCSGCLGRDSFANAATRVGPTVVNISINQPPYLFGGGGGSIGSGTIIDENGTILTCAHNVVDFHSEGRMAPKGRVDVTLQDGRTFQGTVANADPHSDIAILKIDSKTPLPVAKFGSSSKLRPGDWVIALGCPLSLQNTVTAGIVSCVDRKSSDLGIGGLRREYLQTDCAINPGNSGGPLVNIDGEVVGVNILKVLAADGLSFAVPIDSVTKILEHFKKSGRIVRPWLGLKMIDLNDMIIKQLKEKDAAFPNVKRGILVAMVTPRSPADRAGFQPGDVVVEFDEKSVGTIKEVIETMSDRVGEPLKVVVIRDADRLVTLTVIPEESNPNI